MPISQPLIVLPQRTWKQAAWPSLSARRRAYWLVFVASDGHLPPQRGSWWRSVRRHGRHPVWPQASGLPSVWPGRVFGQAPTVWFSQPIPVRLGTLLPAGTSRHTVVSGRGTRHARDSGVTGPDSPTRRPRGTGNRDRRARPEPPPADLPPPPSAYRRLETHEPLPPSNRIP